MSNKSSDDLIDDVAPGDIIAVASGQPYKVVHKQSGADADTYVVTFEKDDGETFQKEFPAGTRVTRSPDAKWESAQSPTGHRPDAP
jgi:phage-related tail fiber protein